MEFAEATTHLARLLTRMGWPDQIVWVSPERVVHIPFRATVVFRPEPDHLAAEHASRLFREKHGQVPAILLYAVGHAGGRTFASIRVLEELAQGEDLFITDGLKIAAQGDESPTFVVRFRIAWWLHQRIYDRWQRRTQRALDGG